MIRRGMWNQKRVLVTGMALFFLPVFPLAVGRAQDTAGRAADEAAIRQVVVNFSDGWNRHDARAMCADLAEDGDFITWRGEQFHGRKSFEDHHASLFAGLYNNTRRTDNVKRIWWLTPDIASVDDYWTMTGARTREGSDWPYREGYFNFLMIKRNGRWLVVLSHAADFNASRPPATPNR